MMRSLYRRRFLHTFYLGSRQGVEQFHEARLVRITNGRLATWLHPFGMLEPQVVVNLLPKLVIGADLVRHGYVKDSGMPRGSVHPTPRWNGRPATAPRTPANTQVSALENAVRDSLRCARRSANSIALWRWRCSNTARSPLWVSVGVDFARMSLFLIFISGFLFEV